MTTITTVDGNEAAGQPAGLGRLWMQEQTEWAVDEIERLINDPSVPLRAHRVWELAELASRPSNWSQRSERRIDPGTTGVLRP